MQNKTKQFRTIILLLNVTFFTLPLKAQVTIGDQTAPQSFSLLELRTTQREGGLRLPQLTTTERDAIATDAFKVNPLAKGLIIFNISTGCVNIWDGKVWIEWCASQVQHLQAYSQASAGFYRRSLSLAESISFSISLIFSITS
jgi:hypothetical protein